MNRLVWTPIGETIAAIAITTGETTNRLLNRLKGPRCPRCWTRVHPRHQHLHDKDCD